jgi:hypothetical protein
MYRGLQAVVMTAFVVSTVSYNPAAKGVTLPFTEEFPTNNADWGDASSLPTTWVAAGGPDGSSYTSASFNFFNFGNPFPPAQFRGHKSFNSSDQNFVGDWLASGVDEFTTYVRHDAPFPLTYYVRFASEFNFPGAFAVAFIPVQPNTWTPISVTIDANNPQFVSFEGSDFNTVFSSIGNVQIGVDLDDSLTTLDRAIVFDLDKPTITPEPASPALLALGSCIAIGSRRRNR